MAIDFLKKIFIDNLSSPAIIWNDKIFKYEWLLEKSAYWQNYLKINKITSGKVIGLKGDFSPNSIALLVALIDARAIIVPLAMSSKENPAEKIRIAQVESLFSLDEQDNVVFERENLYSGKHSYYDKIRNNNSPGLVLFSSGTSGQPKGAVHDFSKLLDKFKNRRSPLRTVNFLLFDHWGGLNTLLHTIANAGVVLATRERSPEEVCAYIEKHKIELLPTSPTFLNLLLISEAYRRYDLTSLKIITYGTEPMAQETLNRMLEILPNVKFQQTYGLIEVGVLRSKSKENNSLWLKVGGEGYETRIVDSILQIKADSAMLGYLNAPSPFTQDGWFVTGDYVEVDGDYLRILGRKSEIINVGGEKVYPIEVENVIQSFENIAEVTVFGELNTIIGQIVCARIRTIDPITAQDFVIRLKKYCSTKLERYKVPVKIEIDNSIQFNERFKKNRSKPINLVGGE